jgi:hypothetical protein
MAKGPAQKINFFYCYQCRDYELKTSPHFRNQERRFVLDFPCSERSKQA